MSQDKTKIPIQFNPQQQRMIGRTMHKGLDFDVPFITQIVDGLWQGGCQEGLILPSHINYVVSLYPWERYGHFHELRGELYVRMYDDPSQNLSEIDDIARLVNDWRRHGRQVLVHCQAGLNRSSVVVARALMLEEGLTADEAINLIRDKRSPACLCNDGFVDWLRSL